MIYGKLKIIDEIRDDKDKVLCQCDCGNIVTVMAYYLRKGNTKTCGQKSCKFYSNNKRQSQLLMV